MDNIVKIAIIIGIIIIGITGIVVYFKIKQIDKINDIEEGPIIEEKDSINLNLLNEVDNSNNFFQSKELVNEYNLNTENELSKEDTSIKEDFPNITNELESKTIVENSIYPKEIKNIEIPKEELKPKEEQKIENIPKKEIINNINTSSSKPYSNKYSSASTLISPVGYYSSELIRNDLMGKRASKVNNNVISKEEVKKEVKEEIKKEVKEDIKEEVVRLEEKNNKISFSDMKQNYIKNDKPKNFMEEVSEKLSKELKPQTIELTDYEQKQEDEAIISYQELLANKDKTFNISDEEEDEDFILALKSFRESL